VATGIGRKIAAGGGVDESTVVATGETRGGRCGSCGLELLSTDFGGLAKTGPLRLCSWAASTSPPATRLIGKHGVRRDVEKIFHRTVKRNIYFSI